MALAIEGLECGDIVRLNGGVMRLTVDHIDDGQVVAVYEEAKDGIMEIRLDPRMLTFVCKADPSAPRPPAKK